MVTNKPYRIVLHRAVIEEDSKRFNEATKEKIKKKCRELLSIHPQEVGEQLHGELKKYRKLKIFSDIRIIYRIDQGKVIVFILAVGIRRDDEIYKEALKRIR